MVGKLSTSIFCLLLKCLHSLLISIVNKLIAVLFLTTQLYFSCVRYLQFKVQFMVQQEGRGFNVSFLEALVFISIPWKRCELVHQ